MLQYRRSVMRRIGYARVSTVDQDLTIQRNALEDCDVIFEEKVSGKARTTREQLELALKVLTKGDSLVVTRLDRLGRSLRDLANIAQEIEAQGASLCVLEQAVDTSTSAGKAFFGMLAVFAEFETDVRRERQLEGIAKVMADPTLKAKKYKGRPAMIDTDAIIKLKSDGFGPSQIANKLGISRQTVYRHLDKS